MSFFYYRKKIAYFFREWLIRRPKEYVNLLKHKELYKSESYFPELSNKKRNSRQVLIDQCRTIAKYGTPNKYYFAYGMDVKSKDEQAEYIHFDSFFRRICQLNQSPANNCCCILRNKLLFNIVARGIGIDTPNCILFSDNGRLFDFSSNNA